jgi:hypothetical protein
LVSNKHKGLCNLLGVIKTSRSLRKLNMAQKVGHVLNTRSTLISPIANS